MTTRTLILAVLQQYEQLFCKANITSANRRRNAFAGPDKELVDVGKRLVNCDPLVTPFLEFERDAERRPMEGGYARQEVVLWCLVFRCGVWQGQSPDDKSHVAVDEPLCELLEEVLLLLDFIQRLYAAVYSGVDGVQIWARRCGSCSCRYRPDCTGFEEVGHGCAVFEVDIGAESYYCLQRLTQETDNRVQFWMRLQLFDSEAELGSVELLKKLDQLVRFCDVVREASNTVERVAV